MDQKVIFHIQKSKFRSKSQKTRKKSGQKIKKHRIYRPRNGSKIHFSYPEMGQKFRNILIFRNSFFRASNYSKMHILTGNGLSFGFRNRRWVFLALAEMTHFFGFWAGNGSFFSKQEMNHFAYPILEPNSDISVHFLNFITQFFEIDENL